MAMKQCPICGEKYSETYKNCPFCEEEESLRESEGEHRSSRKGKRAARSRQFSLITPTLIVLIIMMASLLVYLLYGSQLAERFSGKNDPQTEQTDPVDQEHPDETDETDPSQDPEQTEDPDGTIPDTPDEAETDDSETDDTQTTEPETSSEYDEVKALPDGLTLSTTDFSLFNLGETATIKVTSGGSGSYTWVSEDDGIASVDSNGKVTAVSGGTVNILVTDGKKKGTCIVRVKATGSLPNTPSSGTGSGSYKLNNEDFTRPISEGSYQLKVSGATSGITWSSSNTSVATVDSTGKVTPVGVGTATITASVNGQTLTCIIRVPR